MGSRIIGIEVLEECAGNMGAGVRVDCKKLQLQWDGNYW